MRSNAIKAKAKSFFKKYKLNNVDVPNLKDVLKKQGYTLIEFNHVVNSEAVSALIKALGIEQNIASSKGFTYADEQRRLVFVHEDLTDEEKRIVLAHEEGHIFCGHLSSASIIGRDVREEHEANEFAHYILKDTIGRKIRADCQKHKKGICVVAALMVVAIIGAVIFGIIKKEQSYYGEYYLTSTGNKYHEKECVFVKDKTNTQRLTVDQFESGEYEPCAMCLPD